MQKRPRTSTVAHQESCRFRVTGQVDIPTIALHDGKVAHEVDVGRNVFERTACEIDGDALDAGGVELGALGRVPEPRDGDDVVLAARARTTGRAT